MKYKFKFSILLLILLLIFITSNAQEKYAVLICGDKPVEEETIATAESGWGDPGDEIRNEFWNDTYLMWEMLVYEKGYSNDNVFVLYYDGSDYDIQGLADRYNADIIHNENYPITDLSATKDNVEDVFTGLATGTGGYPQITQDDFLFVWTFGHGTIEEPNAPAYLILYPKYDYSDVHFAAQLDNINCNKKVFWMQQCIGGSFVDNLEAPNTVFQSAGSVGELAAPADNDWELENEIINGEVYQHGEFNYHVYSSIMGESPDYNDHYGTEPYSDADVNFDNVISVYESWIWEQAHETKNETPLYSNLGNIGPFTSLKYPTLLHQNITATETHRGLIGISKTIHITQGNQLTLKQNADVVILNNSELIVDQGATLIIEDNVEIRGNINNKIIINGNVQLGENLVFAREGSSGYFSGIYFNNKAATINLTKASFINAKFHNYSSQFNVTNSTFTNCDIVYSYDGDVTFSNCSNITSTWLYLENQSLLSNVTATVYNCNFTDQNSSIAAIHLENYEKFDIEYNTIDGYYVGMQLMRTGAGASGNQSISLNEIRNCHVGINAYNTLSKISNNYIHDNEYGLKINNNCNTDLSGNPFALNWGQTQQVLDNDYYELYFSSGSFPWNFQYNVVVDEDNAGNPTDPMVYYQPPSGGGQILDVRNNCWGTNFNPADDFYGGVYIYNPTWCPPAVKSANVNVDSAKALYMHAKAQFDSADYNNAKVSFMQVVNQYSITKFASASMKDLFSLEQFENNNYEYLKGYYQTDSIIQNDTILEDLSGFLANKCDVQLQNWQSAIDHYETIIINPETFEDSVYAVIDLGQLYLLMQNIGSREVVQGQLSEFIPSSKMGFINNRNYLLSLLPEKKTTNQDLPENTMLKAGELLQNQPNPFFGKTTIQYKLRKGGFVKIKVFSQSGSIVKSLEFEKDAGTHSVELNLQDLSNGIYFYSLEINGVGVDTKKMVLVK